MFFIMMTLFVNGVQLLSMNNYTLQDKVILITGASKGIGKACALLFAQQGAKVALFARDKKDLSQVEKELKTFGNSHLVEMLDINDHSSVKTFLKKIHRQLGSIDVLINNAGFGLVKKFDTTSDKDFDDVMNTNFKAAFFTTQMALPLLSKNANIIFISSIHSEHPSLDPIYDASKAALNNLMMNLSLQLAPQGIRVNTVVPGHIDVTSPQTPRAQTDVPLGKLAGLPIDVAKACLFLADNQQSSYITGTILPVTGGLHIPIAKDINF